mgnify:CR=1 FL=1
MGFPLELITMLGSTVLGGVMTIWGQSIKAKAEQSNRMESRKRFCNYTTRHTYSFSHRRSILWCRFY